MAEQPKTITGVGRITYPRSDTQLPKWRRGMSVGEWRRIRESEPKRCEDPAWLDARGNNGALKGVSGPFDMIGAWNGAVLYENRIYNAASGGHAGFAGNAVIECDLMHDTPRFRVAKTSTPAKLTRLNARTYLDGAPVSRHTYWSHVAVPSLGRVMLMGSSACWTGISGGELGNFPNIVGYRVKDAEWDADGTFPDFPRRSIHPDATVFQDPVNEAVYLWGGYAYGNHVSRFNAAVPASTEAVWDNNAPSLYSPSCGVDTRRRRVFLFSARPFYPQPKGPCLLPMPLAAVPRSAGFVQCTFTGPAAAKIAAIGHPSIVFVRHESDPSRDAFYLRGGGSWSGGLTYRIGAVPDAERRLYCEAFATSGGDAIPDTGTTAPLYNRWLPAADLGGIVLMPQYAKELWFLCTSDIG